MKGVIIFSLALFIYLGTTSCSSAKQQGSYEVERTGTLIIGDTSAILVIPRPITPSTLYEYTVEKDSNVLRLQALFTNGPTVITHCVKPQDRDSMLLIFKHPHRRRLNEMVYRMDLGAKRIDVMCRTHIKVAREDIRRDSSGKVRLRIFDIGGVNDKWIKVDSCDYIVFVYGNAASTPIEYRTFRVARNHVILSTGERLRMRRTKYQVISDELMQLIGAY